VLLFANVCDAKGVLAAAVLAAAVLVTETGVVEAGIEVEIVVVAELAEPEVLTPCSAKMVPNVGT
jgi:fructose-specific component phosphotransferase system IIB-like protein